MKVSAKVGDSIELDCSSDGYPHSEALWYKYNIPLLDITYRKLEGTLKSAPKCCILVRQGGERCCFFGWYPVYYIHTLHTLLNGAFQGQFTSKLSMGEIRHQHIQAPLAAAMCVGLLRPVMFSF